MKHASKIVRTFSDMGSIKIFGSELSCFFDNGVGDGGNRVKIYAKKIEDGIGDPAKFLGHFTVRTRASVQLSGYDCEDDPIYIFGVGRWFVYLIKPAEFAIVLQDIDTDSLES